MVTATVPWTPGKAWSASTGRVEAPRIDLGVERLFTPLEAVGVCGDRADIFLEGAWLRGCGTDDR
jgi:hypothetical protein